MEKVNEMVEVKNVEKKVVRKVIKEVGYDRVISKKGYFSVKDKDGVVIMWAVRDNGNYLYYVMEEMKRELGLRILRMMKRDEELKKQKKAEDSEKKDKEGEL